MEAKEGVEISSRESNDLGALSEEQQQKLDQLKIKIRQENEHYFRKHPEIQLMTAGVMRDILNKQPDDPQTFIASYFTDPTLNGRISNQVQERSLNIRRNSRKLLNK
ncbi:RIIa domain-containing protein 1 [Trichoplax sp. H2]|nr:RIIa domain-containing protein 1 [Trichoplax sp. H2]|eukprot:RDD40376.1 RIIa domain-containing protein 1 [Trichoplax sp. H2]